MAQDLVALTPKPFTPLQDLVALLQAKDVESARSAALALGNIIVEEEARGRFLQVGLLLTCLLSRELSLGSLVCLLF